MRRRYPALRPSERFALRLLRGEGEATDRAWLLALAALDGRWAGATVGRALLHLWRCGLAVRWPAGRRAFYKLSEHGERAAAAL